jgi:hypothetical protein
MSIPSITEAGRVPTSTAGRASSAASATPTRQGGDAAAASTDEVPYHPPAPPRFPWLSRLSQQLESVAKQKPAFPSAPILGDNVDKSA